MGRRQKNKQKHANYKQRKKGNRNYNQLEWKQELLKLQRQLRGFGLIIREVEGDGNCLFRAVSDQLLGTESQHDHYRQLSVSQMLAHREDYEPFVEDDADFEEYISKMRKSAIWGGNLELQALSIALMVNIRIHILDSPLWEIMNFDLSSQTIHLSFHDGDHYNSVRLQTDDTGEAARQIPHSLQSVRTKEENEWSAWEEATQYAMLITGEENAAVIAHCLKRKYSDPPSIDQLNTEVEQLFKEFAGAHRETLTEHKPAEEEKKQNDSTYKRKHQNDTVLKPRVLPSTNSKCWCGSNKKYKKCCKAFDVFRDSEPEKTVGKLESLLI